MDFLKCNPNQWYLNETKYLELLQNEEIWNQIPLLNANELHDLQDWQLVRFRGMIQDMHGPELYLEKFTVRNTETAETTIKFGKYVDAADCKPNETIEECPSTIPSERHVYVAVSIPGINPWVHKLEEDKYKLPSSNPSTSMQNNLKRPVQEMEVTSAKLSNAEPLDSNKRSCTHPPRPEETTPFVSQEYLLNFPIPNPSGKVCRLKIYKDTDKIKLNSVFEFVGFLSLNPILGTNNDDDMNGLESQIHNPPSSLIPRIHCVTFKSLSHNNPLVTQEKLSPDKMQVIRKELLILLTQLMCGDELAAEYLIYHFISQVYLRKDFMALGKFSLNISNVPMLENIDYVQELYKFIELLTTKSHYLPMLLEYMNELNFVPKKDYNADRLTSSVLQLSDNTHLVLDETKLTPGKLNQSGVTGVRALSNTIKNQKIMYDFTYYQLEYDCDIPFLVLSEGKSMLPSDVHVILAPETTHLRTFSEILGAARHFLKPELLDDIRLYLTSARLTQYDLSDNVLEMVQNKFVEMRQSGHVTGDDLHSLLVLARLVCISQGKNTLDEGCWKKACALEEARKERIKYRSS
ncbi:mini-chromosome maintenance complex-binding protein [Tribolium madens]|uniref:mini-chromosome maintenance complex-binding protein n=1 Tax=Tribolium madens TaxID=41895 RepID=UPI001CF73A59|nr:mini-chromosome maintenance complex-binding protein [Tribolium madens]